MKKIILIACLVVAVVLGGTVGPVLAHNGNSGEGKPGAAVNEGASLEQGPRATLLARVAEILGIDVISLESAYIQARKDMSDEAVVSRLNKLVELGKITREQADQIKQWWASRPDVLPRLSARLSRIPIRPGKDGDAVTPRSLEERVAEILGIEQQKLHSAIVQAKQEAADSALSQRLQKLVDQGKITQEQADQYKQWWQDRPNMPLPSLKQLNRQFRGRMVPGPGKFRGVKGLRGNPGTVLPDAATATVVG